MAKRVFNGPVLHCECGNHVFKRVGPWAVVLASVRHAGLLAFRWFVCKKKNIQYIGRASASRFFHREAVGAGSGQIVDHANSNGLDNRDENLRLCSHAENMRNSRLSTGRKTSRFKGVYINDCGKWRAAIQQNGEYLHLGTFQDEERAARQYDRAARIFFGKFARTNANLGLL